MKTSLPLFVLVLASTQCNAVGRYKCRARQAEAKTILTSIKSAEASYFAQHASYTASTSDLNLPMSPQLYSIELSITSGGKGYKATAKGDKTDTMGDEWTVDESGAMKAVTDKCESE